MGTSKSAKAGFAPTEGQSKDIKKRKEAGSVNTHGKKAREDDVGTNNKEGLFKDDAAASARNGSRNYEIQTRPVQ